MVVVLVRSPPSCSSWSSSGNKKLSHTAVESWIQTNLGATNVNCNGGKDFEMKNKGDTFTCTGDGGKTFTVTINNTDNGDYSVSAG